VCIVEKGKIFNIVDAVLANYLVIITLLSALMSFFVFIINWEDRFMGIKLDGLPAGISLFCKGFVALLLALLALKYREKIELITACVILYFAYLFGPVLFMPHIIPTFSGTLTYLLDFWLGIGIPIVLLVIHRLSRIKEHS
jgi:hypothetical protein